mmetsp:Transcript_31875/g.31141  ORF Transcript_31875/g.31141 Transcript_31875/m.31141 type:complete len:81 (-) Transcript_31875:297-539(-)
MERVYINVLILPLQFFQLILSEKELLLRVLELLLYLICIVFVLYDFCMQTLNLDLQLEEFLLRSMILLEFCFLSHFFGFF